jgi:hypothetical protein
MIPRIGAIKTMDRFRCVRASRLLLDHQLHGVRLSGTSSPAPERRKYVEDATLLAFDHVIDACLVHDADCLLLSGDSFHPDDRSLRGPAALVRGIQRLAERDIAVLLEAGRPEVWSSWPAGLRLPPNAHRLGDGFENQVPVSREGKLLATISIESQAESARRDWQILIPAAAGTSRTLGLPLSFTPVQGIRADETGPHGCILTNIDAGEGPHDTFIPTAPVRWEHFEIAVAAGTTRDDLLQEMAARLEQTPRKPCEKIWLVGWDITGTGDLLKALSEPGFRDGLAGDLTGLGPVPGIHVQTHAVRVRLSEGATPEIAGDDELVSAYTARLQQRFAHTDASLVDIVSASAIGSGPWKLRLETILAGMDTGEIARDVQRLAGGWFASSEELSS